MKNDKNSNFSSHFIQILFHDPLVTLIGGGSIYIDQLFNINSSLVFSSMGVIRSFPNLDQGVFESKKTLQIGVISNITAINKWLA